MGLEKTRAAPEVRQWLGNLLVAWTFVTGLAAVFASALYQRTGDIKILIAYLGAPFLIGTALFIAIGIFGLVSRTARHVSEPRVAGARRRNVSIFSRPARSPDATWLVERAADDATHAMRVTVRARPEVDDVADFQRVLLEARHVWVATGALGVAAALAWAQLVAPRVVEGPAALAVPAALSVAALYLFWLLRAPRRVAKRSFRTAGGARMTTYRFGPDGIELQDARRTGRFMWREVSRVQETKRLLIVHTATGEDILLPKRDLGNEIVVQQLRDVLAANLRPA